MVVYPPESAAAENMPATAPPIDHPPLLTTTLSPPWPVASITKHETNATIIFPPANHENLHISPDQSPLKIHIDLFSSSSDSGSISDSDSISNSYSTFSPSDSDSPLFSRPKSGLSIRSETWTERLCYRFYSAVKHIWSFIGSSRGLWLTFRSAVVVLGFLYFRQRRRLRAGEETRARLIGVIGDKDQKINQLLDQVSRMNQVLLAMHKIPNSE